MVLQRLVQLSSLLISVAALAPSGPWDAFNYAPADRTVYPTAIHSSHGFVSDVNNLVGDGAKTATLKGNGSWVALDFGKEVGGLITLNLAPSSSAALALAFTESPEFIRPYASDDSSGTPEPNTTFDGVLHAPSPLPSGPWTQPQFSLRGGFRYLTLVLSDDGTDADAEVTLGIANVSCAIEFMPHVDDMRAYTGYFYANDPVGVDGDHDFLTKIWYAGAYTVQTNTVPLHTGRMVPFLPPGIWANNATLGVAGPIIVDGAKRDRAVWPGDMGIAVPTQFVSTNDLMPTRNALSTMFSAINPLTGALPESGPPLSQTGSDTYHMWTLIGTCQSPFHYILSHADPNPDNYFLYSGDTEWLQTIWTNYTKAVAFLEGKVDDEAGLIDITGLRDWARLGGGGYNVEGNAIFYKVLTTATDLATVMNDTDLASAWAVNATGLKQAFNDAFWLESAGQYRDNSSTTLCPEDGNSFAVLFNLTQSQEQMDIVSEGLQGNWNNLGPVAPELPDTISPFIAGFELQAHFKSGNDARAMNLLRRTWGYMLYTPLSVQSTLLEGFTANGSLSYRSYRGYNYDPAYTSHAHGWSTGPTSALTYYVLGLTVTSPQGADWSLAPHVVDTGLSDVQGGFETPLGWFGAHWVWSEFSGFQVQVNAPKGTSGVFVVPQGISGTLVVGGANKGQVAQGQSIALEGGEYTVSVTPTRK
ncbi:hypothetical protein H0H92_012614 [Tricholoma furcatifolium]|nr:hypothetical protein H0H92_012614 [Tricholoma furcatifolium]